MTLREWLAFPFAVLSFLCEDAGEWLADRFSKLADRIAGPNRARGKTSNG